MKFEFQVSCGCGYNFPVSAIGEANFPITLCPKCGVAVGVTDPLSISVSGERLLHRSKREIETGDFTLSIILGAIAVECFLIGAFLKWKSIENYQQISDRPSESDHDGWVEEYRKRLSFLQTADFVSNYLTKSKLDDFVARTSYTTSIIAPFSLLPSQSPKQYFYDELFVRRNHILHRGMLSYGRKDSDLCLKIATSIIWIVKAMDNQRRTEM